MYCGYGEKMKVKKICNFEMTLTNEEANDFFKELDIILGSKEFNENKYPILYSLWKYLLYGNIYRKINMF